MNRLKWKHLLSRSRIGSNGKHARDSGEASRTAFERDWDRIVFSASFRRMQDKTQVFPMPEDDFVHTRLTHSIEVASVGRSLGASIGEFIKSEDKLPDGHDIRDVAQVVANACLAHDIGNPPFGHAGESAIADSFRTKSGQEILASLDELQKGDFLKFEGNAQGFRILTRLEHENSDGLHLTAATLGAFMKYPQASNGKRWGKHGVNAAELEIFEHLTRQLKIPTDSNECCRHPLAFLVEAADDICYSVLDIEDGYRIGVSDDDAWNALVSVARAADTFDEKRFNSMIKPRDRAGYARSMAIKYLVGVAIESFKSNYPNIIHGTAKRPLLEDERLHATLKKAAKACLYSSPKVLEPEIAAHAAISGLLDLFLPVVLATSEEDANARGNDLSKRAYRFLTREAHLDKVKDIYNRTLLITDYISGMTDRYALLLFRRLTGTATQGRFA